MVTLPEPGFWEIDESEYHADPAPVPSLSNSVAQILLEQCPRAAWHAHPRLNPQFRPDESERMEKGTVAHTLLLGRGASFCVIEAEDYRTKAAQLERDVLRAAGRTPILARHHEAASAMAITARKQLKDIEGGEYAFNPDFGDIELCALSKDPVGCWLRTLIDFYGAKVPDGVTCWDYKTTAAIVNPTALGARMDDDWALQAAFQERVICTLKPELAGRIKHRFLVQQNVEPYLCSVVEPSSAARTIAHKKIAAAIAIWHACMERGVWPAYARTSTPIGGTAWKEAAWLSRELNDEMVQLAANDPFLTTAFATHPRAGVGYDRVPEVTIAPAIYKPRGKRRYKPAKPGDKRRKENKPKPPGASFTEWGGPEKIAKDTG